MAEIERRVMRVPTCRASVELQSRRPLTPAEDDRFRAAIPDVGLAGAPFDEASFIYPFEILREPSVVVLSEAPRRVSLRVRYKQGLYVGIIGDQELEAAYVGHPGAFLFVVGALQERQKGDKTFLDVHPRGWIIIEVGADTEEVTPAGRGISGGNKKKGKRAQ